MIEGAEWLVLEESPSRDDYRQVTRQTPVELLK